MWRRGMLRWQSTAQNNNGLAILNWVSAVILSVNQETCVFLGMFMGKVYVSV